MSEPDLEGLEGLSYGDPLSSSRAPDLRFFADGKSCELRLQKPRAGGIELQTTRSSHPTVVDACESPDLQSRVQQQRRPPQLTVEICDSAAQARDPHAEFRAGRSLEDYFVVQRQLGRGAFSTVFQ
jgi:hypothetical protein